jgi:hypothetical protein
MTDVLGIVGVALFAPRIDPLPPATPTPGCSRRLILRRPTRRTERAAHRNPDARRAGTAFYDRPLNTMFECKTS